MSAPTSPVDLLAGTTPGPWEPIKGLVESDEMRCGVVAVREDRQYLLATIENGAPGDFCDTEWANARLTAAAPQLAAKAAMADAAAFNAVAVLENKAVTAWGALEDGEWMPDRTHVEGMRSAMVEVIDLLREAFPEATAPISRLNSSAQALTDYREQTRGEQS